MLSWLEDHAHVLGTGHELFYSTEWRFQKFEETTTRRKLSARRHERSAAHLQTWGLGRVLWRLRRRLTTPPSRRAS